MLNKGITKTQVTDSVMGSGKSTAIIEYSRDTKNPCIIIVERNSEVERYTNALPTFTTPLQDDGYLSRYHSLIQMLKGGASIVSTHQLFSKWDNEVLRIIYDKGYSLIMDEVVSGVIEQLSLKSKDIEILIDKNFMEVELLSSPARLKPTGEEFLDKYNAIKDKLNNKDIFLHTTKDKANTNYLAFDALQSSIFRVFKEVTILTYLFEGSVLDSYFKLHGINYKLASVKDGVLVPYQGSTGYQFKGLINIYRGKHNDIGKHNTALSKHWCEKAANISSLSKSIRNVFNSFGADKRAFLWTTHKSYRDKVSQSKFHSKRIQMSYEDGKQDYTNDITFIPQNIRGSNLYADKTQLAYCSNTFMQPVLKQFLEANEVAVDENQYALSQLIQWIWRSAIRNNKPIDVYVPSRRMRGLLMEWLGYDKDEIF